MRLEYLCDYTATLKPGISAGKGPLGERLIVDVTGGEFKGPRLSGRVRASGADWALVDAAGKVRLDVRVVFEADDGAVIYITYRGRLELNEKAAAALEGKGGTEYGDVYLMTQLQFETGDERYAWLNDRLAVGEGRLGPHSVTYRVYTLETD